LENDEVNQTAINDIYQIFDEHGKMIEIDNIPVILHQLVTCKTEY